MVKRPEKTDDSLEPDAGAADGKIMSTVEWNDEKMVTNFANVVNVQGIA